VVAHELPRPNAQKAPSAATRQLRPTIEQPKQSVATSQGTAQVPLLSPTLPSPQHVPLEQLRLQHSLPSVHAVPGFLQGEHALLTQLLRSQH
jgi:hypothetical protein